MRYFVTVEADTLMPGAWMVRLRRDVTNESFGVPARGIQKKHDAEATARIVRFACEYATGEVLRHISATSFSIHERRDP